MISVAALQELADSGLTGEPHPAYPGVVLGVDHGGRREIGYAGEARRYGSDGLLPPEERIPVTADTVFDLASLTKLVTTLVAVGELDDLDEPVAARLTAYDRPATRAITPRQLLTHTSGLPAEVQLPGVDADARTAALLATDPVTTPGTTVTYSCTGFLVLQRLLERRTGQGLDALVAGRISRPLGLGLTYRPRYAGVPVDRLAATELRDAAYHADLGPVLPSLTPDPGDLRGVVHDENAASLGGVAGNAGLFGTATDVLDLGRTVLDALNGRKDVPGLDRGRLRATVTAQVGPGQLGPGQLGPGQLGPGVAQPAYASGLGFRIDDPGFMGGLAGTGQAYGHTGFTGTSLVIDEARDVAVAILTNRVHPSRTWSDVQPYRRRVHTAVAAGVS